MTKTDPARRRSRPPRSCCAADRPSVRRAASRSPRLAQRRAVGQAEIAGRDRRVGRDQMRDADRRRGRHPPRRCPRPRPCRCRACAAAPASRPEAPPAETSLPSGSGDQKLCAPCRRSASRRASRSRRRRGEPGSPLTSLEPVRVQEVALEVARPAARAARREQAEVGALVVGEGGAVDIDGELDEALAAADLVLDDAREGRGELAGLARREVASPPVGGEPLEVVAAVAFDAEADRVGAHRAVGDARHLRVLGELPDHLRSAVAVLVVLVEDRGEVLAVVPLDADHVLERSSRSLTLAPARPSEISTIAFAWQLRSIGET